MIENTNRTSDSRVVAVILTYNRRNLLRECLQAILGQTRLPDEIVVTNNDSTDGTDKMLAEEFPRVTHFRLPENVGASAGFHESLKYAYEKRPTWIWIMDDDGKPSAEALECLLQGTRQWGLDLAAPLTLDTTDPHRLAFPLMIEGRVTTNVDHALHEPVIHGEAPLWNGVLLNAELIHEVGLPDKRLFFHGEEVEYGWRLRRKGTHIGVVTTALFYHPFCGGHLVLPAFLFGGKARVGYTGSQLKDYCTFRNYAYINLHARKRCASLKSLVASFVLNTIFFILIRRMDLCGYRLWVRATVDGLRGKLGDPRKIISD